MFPSITFDRLARRGKTKYNEKKLKTPIGLTLERFRFGHTILEKRSVNSDQFDISVLLGKMKPEINLSWVNSSLVFPGPL